MARRFAFLSLVVVGLCVALAASSFSLAAQPTTERPPWLGTRVLPTGPDGFGEVRPTPGELRDRQLPPPDGQPPADGDEFSSTIDPVPRRVVERSTWSPRCPVAVEDLRYLTLSFWGFDQHPHRGEMLVHASVAKDVAAVFRRLYDARFPIEEMRVVTLAELDAPPTGDGNNTTAFVCRATTGGTSWSQHAYGLAVDVNPFHNPYVKGGLVLPELASSYADRGWRRPGMIFADDEVTGAFASIGWGWGGGWSNTKDWMHFSRNGR
ncbi:MAG: M15 family metallopeptidase [Egibacteraceae bacterium]